MLERNGQIAGLVEHFGDQPGEIADRRRTRREAGRADARRATPAAYSTRSKSKPSSPPPDVDDVGEAVGLQRFASCQSTSSGRSSSAWPMIRSSAPGSSGASSPSGPHRRNRRGRLRRSALVRARFEQRVLRQFLGDERVELEVADSCSSLIACVSWGVSTSCCDWRMLKEGPRPMGADSLQREALAEVEAPDLLVGDQRFGSALRTAPGRRR